MSGGDTHEIMQSLGRIEGNLTTALQRLDEHHSLLYGNGQPGMKTRLDRLEQLEIKRAALVKGSVGVALAALAAAIKAMWK